MAIKKRSINVDLGYSDYSHLDSHYNDSNINNASHKASVPFNLNLKTITLEDCDQAVYQEFNNRFKIGENNMSIILLDAELTSLKEQNRQQYDKQKDFLNGPFFTMYRKESKMKYKSNPSYKQVVALEIKEKENGIVYEEWLAEGPLSYDLIYEFKFITNYREYTNEFERQMRHYFRNRRNIIVCQNERFSIGPVNYEVLSDFEITNREDAENRTLYISTFNFKLECFTRDMSTMQKRERPNKVTFSFQVPDGKTTNIIDEKEINLNNLPSSNNPA